MLQLSFYTLEFWDKEKQEFVPPQLIQTISLKHSLVSVDKWESKWKKPFLSNQEKTEEETIDYVKCMTITQNVKPEIYSLLTDEHRKQIQEYIEDPYTATTFTDHKFKKNKKINQVITSEILYYLMTAYNIPENFEKRHLNKLLTLIKVCDIKNSPEQKKSKKQTMMDNTALNRARKKQLNIKN